MGSDVGSWERKGAWSGERREDEREPAGAGRNGKQSALGGVHAAGCSGNPCVSLATLPAGDEDKHEGRDKPKQPRATGGRGQHSTGFLQAIRGSQRHQENLGGPRGRNRQVTCHKHSRTGAREPWGPGESRGHVDGCQGSRKRHWCGKSCPGRSLVLASAPKISLGQSQRHETAPSKWLPGPRPFQSLQSLRGHRPAGREAQLWAGPSGQCPGLCVTHRCPGVLR